MSEEDKWQKAVNNKIDSIMKAAKDIQNNPEKAESFIRETVDKIYKAGILVGKQSVVSELFG